MAMSPREIVNELDRYIIGQEDAKRRWLLPFAIVTEEVSFRPKRARKLLPRTL